MIAVERARGRVRLQLTAVRLGRDLVVALGGGDAPHVGAVAVSQARASLQPGAPRSSTTSVIALLGHKEDALARRLAADLAARLGGVATVACGIHLDGITAEELRDVDALASELAALVVERCGAG